MAILPMLSTLASFIKVRSLVDNANIDNIAFRAHYRLTTAILFGCCILVTANNLIGEPISCVSDGVVPDNVMNTYCWITHTFTLPDRMGKGLGKQFAHPGVSSYTPEDKVRYHSYYQWVPFMLFFQGLMFYVPHFFWKNWEEGKIRLITDGMRGTTVGQNEERVNNKKKLVQYLIDTLNMHNIYASGYFFCEVLNFLNVIGNMFLIDSFLGGEFFTYGTKVLSFSEMEQQHRYDPMVAVFPRVTKCTFHKFGPSGSIQTHDALCILALNILNEKIYIFLWFWFIILAIISGIALAYSIAVVTSPLVREAVLLRRFKFGTPQSVTALIRETQVGDFLLLHLLGQNLNMMQFTEVLDELSVRVQFGNSLPTAPSTLELTPMYSSAKLQVHKETEA